MTGNVVLLGFARSGATSLSIAASLAALAAFLVGAGAAGRLAVASSRHTRLWLCTGSAAQSRRPSPAWPPTRRWRAVRTRVRCGGSPQS
jgi:hypothetical protein